VSAALAAPPLPPAQQMHALLSTVADKSAAQVPPLGVPVHVNSVASTT